MILFRLTEHTSNTHSKIMLRDGGEEEDEIIVELYQHKNRIKSDGVMLVGSNGEMEKSSLWARLSSCFGCLKRKDGEFQRLQTNLK